MDYQKFKKELFEEMRAVLKPHGFAKYGHRFRCARQNGIACMVEVQSHRFGDSLTINVFLGILPVPVTAEGWKDFRWTAQWAGYLGSSLADGWGRQHWVQPHDEDDPLVEDGCITLRWQQGCGPWHEQKVPVPTPQQAKAEVCDLLKNKLLPLFDSLQTPEDYRQFCEDADEQGWDRRCLKPAVYRAYLPVLGREELLSQLDESIRWRTEMRDRDRRRLQALQELIGPKKPDREQLWKMDNYRQSIQMEERVLAEYEQLRQELMAASGQKE